MCSTNCSPARQLVDDLDRWCDYLLHAEELDSEHLPATLDVDEIRQAMGVLVMLSQDSHDRAVYEARLRDQRDRTTLFQEALEEGLEKGTLIGSITMCQELLKQPQTPVAELRALSHSDLSELFTQLRKQLAPNGS